MRRRSTIAVPQIQAEILAVEPYFHFPLAWRSLFRAVGIDIDVELAGAYSGTAHLFSQRTGDADGADAGFLLPTDEVQVVEAQAITLGVRPNHIIREMVDFYEVPVYELNRIKNGADYVTPEGETIPNSVLTRPADLPRSYAYCSDTIYMPEIAGLVEGVDLLFHEATFAHENLTRARETFHTTALQAGELAKAAGVKKLLIGHFSARYEDERCQ